MVDFYGLSKGPKNHMECMSIGAALFNNQAKTLEAQGDFEGAEEAHLESLGMKVHSTSEDSIQAASSRNALGELYMKMEGRWEDARKMLERADRVRRAMDDFDAACTRNNLGQLWEAGGDMVKARAARERIPGRMICSNLNCSLSALKLLSKRVDLQHCTRCKSAFYCCKVCQRQDWTMRHKKWCKMPEAKGEKMKSDSG